MAHRDVVVIGASAGGLEAVSAIVAGLPADFPAAVFIVMHVRENTPSHLPTILNRVGQLPAAHAVDDEPIRRGRIYVAPPGYQTYVHKGRLSVRVGPRENMHRPSIDAIFRTAAHHYGPRVIGVVLSGALDDGSAGLIAVKSGGGIAVVQDPSDAKMPDMPANAIERADADHVIPADQIAPLLGTLVGGEAAEALPGEVPLETVPLETVEEAVMPTEAFRSEELGPPSNVTCPECSGTLFEIDEGRTVRFRCRVGHAYSEESLIKAQTDSVERALWTALRALEERVALVNRIAEFARRRGHNAMAAIFEERSQEIDADVKLIHDVIVNGRTLEPVA